MIYLPTYLLFLHIMFTSKEVTKYKHIQINNLNFKAKFLTYQFFVS